MNKRLTYVAAAVLALHGLVHFLGPIAYFEVATLEGLPYKTTLFGGAFDVGAGGIRLFGTLWAIAGVGFLGAAAGLGTNREYWPPLLVAVTVFSLVLTVADYTVASAGVVVNLLILGAFVYARWRSVEDEVEARRV